MAVFKPGSKTSLASSSLLTFGIWTRLFPEGVFQPVLDARHVEGL